MVALHIYAKSEVNVVKPEVRNAKDSPPHQIQWTIWKELLQKKIKLFNNMYMWIIIFLAMLLIRVCVHIPGMKY